MDNMNGDWDAFEEKVRKNPLHPDECYSEQRHNPYKANCFKPRERFWTKQRVQEWLINIVVLGVVIWVLLSLS